MNQPPRRRLRRVPAMSNLQRDSSSHLTITKSDIVATRWDGPDGDTLQYLVWCNAADLWIAGEEISHFSDPSPSDSSPDDGAPEPEESGVYSVQALSLGSVAPGSANPVSMQTSQRTTESDLTQEESSGNDPGRRVVDIRKLGRRDG